MNIKKDLVMLVSLPDHVLKVLVVFAYPVQEFSVWQVFPRNHHRPGLGVRLRVIDRYLDVQMTEIATTEALNDVQGVAVRMTGVIQPSLFVDASRIDYECVAIPFSNRVAEPRGIAP